MHVLDTWIGCQYTTKESPNVGESKSFKPNEKDKAIAFAKEKVEQGCLYVYVDLMELVIDSCQDTAEESVESYFSYSYKD